MDLNLLNKKAVITGASKGIGKAIKIALEKEGVKCIDISKSTGFDLTKKDGLLRAGEYAYTADILINNVGGGGTWNQWDWEEIMQKNFGVMVDMTCDFLFSRKNWGRVITISSIFGKEKGYNAGFTAAKAAEIAFMKSICQYYLGTTFNTIAPGCINTKEDIEKFANDNNMSLGEPEDVANLVVFLCSDKAKHINGACITCDGGDSSSF
jgi:3-oxoacyl-[acyl-carrier protein] reductase